MKHPLAAIVALVVLAHLAAGCGTGAGGMEGIPPGSDASQQGTAACGGSGEPCCNGTACNAGLVCTAGACSASSSADSSGVEDAAANPADDGGVGDAPGETANGSEAGAASEAGDASVTDAAPDSGDAVVADVAADTVPGPETGADSSADGTVADAGQDAGSADTGSDASAGDASDAGCAVGALACSGQQAQTCTSSGTWQNVGGPCSGSAPVCLAGVCVACAPGSVQCSGSGDGVELCGSDGTWGTAVTCASSMCSMGMCTGTCTQGTTQCSGPSAVQSCVSGMWGTPTTCTTAVANATAACAAGACSFTCNGRLNACSGACVDFQTDDGNCGGCGAACAGGARCRRGSCTTGFGYTPSNFNPATYASDVPASGTTVNCNMTYTSPGTAGASTWCGGTGPYVVPNVAQSGGPSVDILVFSSLTVTSGFTLTLAGTNPVVFAVYGGATIAGTINASASGATPGPGGNNATYCGTAPQDSQNLQWGGGGGGGRAVAGGKGNQGNAFSSDYDNGGTASGNGTAVPLVGGCSGEIGGNRCSTGLNSGNCQVCQTNGTQCEPPGAGGGGVQISAAGALGVTGTIETNGGAGTSGGTGQNGGGGGGSAGDILLEGTTVTQGGTVSANGGAGGVGGTNGGTGGTAGPGGTNSGTSQAAPGNGGGGSGGNQGGGGGGGSYGYVVINAP